MRVSLRARQTAAVTLLIALAMTALSLQHLANLARVGLEDSRGIGELLGRMVYQRARDAIAAGGDPEAALRTDQGIRSILESTAAYGRNVTYAAVVDNEGRAIAHSFPAAEGQKIEAGESLSAVLDRGTIEQIRTIYADRSLEVALPLELGDAPFGAIRVGLSPVLIRDDLTKALQPEQVLAHELQVYGHGVQRIPDLVGHPRHQAPQRSRRQLLADRAKGFSDTFKLFIRRQIDVADFFSASQPHEAAVDDVNRPKDAGGQ